MAKAFIAYDKDLPEIPGRRPWERPDCFLVKDATEPTGWRIDGSGRRPSRLILVPKLRSQVDAWRDSGYDGASDVTRRLFEYWFEGVMQSFAQRAELGRSPWEKLQIFIRESFRLLETEARLFQTFIEFFIVGLKDQPFRRRLRHYYRTLTAAATRIIEQGVAEGQFSTPDAEKTAISIFSLLDGLLLRFVLEPECASPRFEDFVVAFVARSVGYTE